MPYHSDRPNFAESFQVHWEDDYWSPYLAGYPLTSELRARLPDTLVINPPKRRAMPDIFNMGYGGTPNDFVVNERVRQLIEGLEPSVHTFIPVKLREDKSGREHDDYFMLYVGQAIDAVVIEQSDFEGGYGTEGYAKNPSLNLLGRHRALDSHKIAGKHLWRGGIGRLGGGGHPNSSVLFCSDELAKLFKSKKIDGWVFNKPCTAD